MKQTRLPLSAILWLPLAVGHCADTPSAAGNEQVRKIMENYAGRGTLADGTPPTAPADAAALFKLRPGLAVDLMAAEPEVKQPLYMNWDSRGRLWVVQYLQYQFPAGLKVVSYDQHLRAKFDKTPLPPPQGKPGADKITMFADEDGDGVFDGHTDVITGLNIASAALPGAGAIWVLNPPYLLRYPDADYDGKPDALPEVVANGFGIEDTHSVANSLQWGVDGWLYGAQGSTCTANVSSAASKSVRFEGQCIWRYHPVSKKFEVYAEGGGNTFSLDIDAKGRVFSGTNGGGTRGMHYEQGSYGIKSWGKHGPLTNAYAYGWFEHMKHEGDAKRFPQAFVVYEGGLLGDGYEDHIIAPNSLANLVYVSTRLADGSSFRTHDEADLLSTSDRWFRPVDAKFGPDGALYLADWYDTRLSHVRPVDDWHKESGRLYRVRPAGAPPRLAPFDLHTAQEGDLLGHLSNRNRWFRRQAALEIGWRRLSSLTASLLEKVRSQDDPYALDALFALDLLDGVDASLAAEILLHKDPYLRRWAVKIIGEKGGAWKTCAAPLGELARTETHLEVRAQILASAKRLPAVTALPMLRTLIVEVPTGEAHLPLLAWWALEAKYGAEVGLVLEFLEGNPDMVAAPAFTSSMVKRLGQRIASGGGEPDFVVCERLLSVFARAGSAENFLAGVAAAFEGGEFPRLPERLAKALQQHMESQGGGALVAALLAGSPGSVPSALKRLGENSASATERSAIAKALAEGGHEAAVPVFLSLLANGATPVGVKRALLTNAARFSSETIPAAIITGYEAKISGDKSIREEALRLLAGRREWALALMEAVDAWRVPTKHFTPELINLMKQHREPVLDDAILRHWKEVSSQGSLEAKATEANRLRIVLRAGVGDAVKGAAHFQTRCAACHKLFETGGIVGPELTGYERSNVDFWVNNIVYPSLEIREGFANYTARLRSGRVFTGMLESQGLNGVVLGDMAGQKTAIRQTELLSLEASPVSIMPEGLLTGLADVELRDLFAFLMAAVKP
jgi:putative membrane-bound dehydrogenase-like protein